jgi:hypothetical protein
VPTTWRRDPLANSHKSRRKICILKLIIIIIIIFGPQVSPALPLFFALRTATVCQKTDASPSLSLSVLPPSTRSAGGTRRFLTTRGRSKRHEKRKAPAFPQCQRRACLSRGRVCPNLARMRLISQLGLAAASPTPLLATLPRAPPSRSPQWALRYCYLLRCGVRVFDVVVLPQIAQLVHVLPSEQHSSAQARTPCPPQDPAAAACIRRRGPQDCTPSSSTCVRPACQATRGADCSPPTPYAHSCFFIFQPPPAYISLPAGLVRGYSSLGR